MKIKIIALMMALSGWSCACTSGAKTSTTAEPSPTRGENVDGFSADSAYRYIEEQLAFGPRVPGSDAHEACVEYFVDKLKDFGADSIEVHRGSVTAFDGTVLPLANVIARYNPDADHRVLVAAHYDTRPWADRDPNPANHATPIPGANDGASGAAVLLELARNLSQNAPQVGVDLVFVDVEDYGNPVSTDGDDGWCLGSKYWMASQPYGIANKPVYGILLDMVGGRDARFFYEGFSYYEAARPTALIWNEARALGFGSMFVPEVAGAVNDDHLSFIAAGIPTTDIIECNNGITGSFPPYWHTLDDDIQNIDKQTLNAVGTTVLNVLSKERP